MDVDSLLAVHERDPELRTTVAQVRGMRDALAGVEGMQYQPARTAELKATTTANATKAGADALRQMLAEAAREAADVLDARDSAERERLQDMTGHVVDPAAFTVAQTAAEISVLMSDAIALDADTARRAWGYAQPALKAMAAKESRQHRQPGVASAFNAWTVWQARMARLTERAPDRATLSAGAARRQRELRDKVLAVWRVVGLDLMVAKAMLAADVERRTPQRLPDVAAKSSLVVGRWFDQFPIRK